MLRIRIIDSILYKPQITIYLSVVYFLGLGCHNDEKVVSKPVNVRLVPQYENVRLVPQPDTLHFPLGEHTSNRIEAFNVFYEKATAYISLYDRGTKSINIYDFFSGKKVFRKSLHEWINSTKLDKAAVYTKKFDSIYVTTNSALFLLDSMGTVKSKIKFAEESDKWGSISHITPALFRNNLLYIGIKPFVSERSVKAQKKWRVLYEFDMMGNIRNRIYSLPDIYQRNLYGYAFLEYSYCMNDQNNFVFSFAADTNIYETDLSKYHVAYTAKSRFQIGDITPVTLDELRKADSYKLYSLRDSYGAIFFDPYHKRYLRLAKQKIRDSEYESKVVKKKRSVIVFNEKFQIIGEFQMNGEFVFDSMLFVNGNIYARANTKDDHTLHFVRLSYEESDSTQKQIVYKGI